MKFNELDRVKVLRAFPEHDIEKGNMGTVVISFSTPHEAYEVEFCDDFGRTKALFPILPEFLEKAT